MTRVAAVDLGTNSTRLLVADVEGERLDEVVRRLTITRLGEGVDERRRLLPVPIARVRNCLADYRRELEQHGVTRTLAIATSAVRDAENGEAFLGEIEWSYGFTTRLLEGAEEAAMMYRGVTAGREPIDDTLIVDIGGGSTELVLGANGRTCRRDEPRRRLRAADRALPPLGSAGAAASSPGRRHTFGRCSPTTRRAGRSASPAPSRRSPPSISVSPSTTPSAPTATESRVRRSSASSSVSPR